jgi:hypothetical protein
MQGWYSKKDRIRSYTRSAFREFGRHSGCKLNRVRHELVEALLSATWPTLAKRSTACSASATRIAYWRPWRSGSTLSSRSTSSS